MRVSVTLLELIVAISEAAREEARSGEDAEALAAATLLYTLSRSRRPEPAS